MALTQPHRDFLNGQAITDDTIAAHGIRSVAHPDDVPEGIARFFVKGPGILFDWPCDGGRTVTQFRPDAPVIDDKGGVHKYVFPTGCGTFVGNLREPEPANGEVPTYLLVEGTKQMYAALSWTPAEWGVKGIAGCNNWVGADLSWAEDNRVVVLFDSDLKTNRDVYDAAVELKAALEGMGADEVVFATLTNARSKEGLDDVLGRIPQDKRTAYLTRLAKAAKPALGRAPKVRKNEHPLFDGGEFLAQKASEAVLDGQPAALGLGSTIALYRDGAYRLDFGKEPLYEIIQRLLGDKYRPSWRTTIEESLIGVLGGRGMRLPERMSAPLLNVANGMLDMRTGELLPHSPDFMSSLQIPIEWDPSASAPRYESWVHECCPGQVDDLEESVSVMLDPSRTPTKAVFLFGVSRSGKSTFLRITKEIAGSRNTSGVDLHQLSDDTFSAANLYGRMLNSCADLSSEHVRDTSLFKRLTGEDVIQANRKYGAQFAFTNTALLVFSANTLPTVSETSRAYVERIKPFHFPKTFAGREDPGIEDEMMRELPGILVRWVAAWQRFHARGRYAPTDPVVMRRFETHSNRVAMWVSKAARVHEGLTVNQLVGPDQGTGRQVLYEAFCQWLVKEGGAAAMRRSAFLDSLGSVEGVHEVRLRATNKNVGLNVTVRPESERDRSDEYVFTRAKEPSEGVGGVGSVGSGPFPLYVSLTQKKTEESVGGEESEVHGGNGQEVTLPTPPTPSDPIEAPAAEVDQVVVVPWVEPVSLFKAQAGFRPAAVAFDLETPDAKELYSWDTSRGPYARLCGYSVDGSAPVATTDVRELLAVLYAADTITAHNGIGYDLQALARHHGADYERLVAKIHDTLIIARNEDPPLSKGGNPNGWYDLDSIGTRMFGEGKHGDLTALKNRYEGYHLIPTDDPRYRAYLNQDVVLQWKVFERSPMNDYAKREHKALGLFGAMTLRGCRMDVPLIRERAAAEEKQKRDALETLGTVHGLPLRETIEHVTVFRLPKRTRVNGLAEKTAVIEGAASYEAVRLVPGSECGRVRACGGERCVHDVFETRVDVDPSNYEIVREEKVKVYDSPFSTTAGKAWVAALWNRFGVTNPPRTDKGQLSTRGELLQKVADHEKCPPELSEILNLIVTAQGARVVYATMAKYLVGDRVHPRASAEQATGRISLTCPGVSVTGKRGIKVRERAPYLPHTDREVIIAADFDQIDARVVAVNAQDFPYMDLFTGDLDFHSATALSVFGDVAMREQSKPISHGVNYGMGVNTMVNKQGIRRDLAETFVRVMREKYPRVIEWQDRVRAIAERGELLDNGFGRKLRVDPEFAYTQAPAFVGQSGTRDLMIEAILRMPADVQRMIMFTVHDEIVFSVPRDRVEEITATVKAAMTFMWKPMWMDESARPIQIACGVSKPADNWAACYSK